MRPICLLLLTLLTLVTGCASSTDEPTWRYAYRIENAGQGCTVARSVEPAVVELKWPAPVADDTGGYTGWYHPCQDGSDRLCPDVGAPGMFVDVYALGDVDPHDFVVIEACR